ncbi:hypothetical protein D3C78_1675710 [compost metagenome]
MLAAGQRDALRRAEQYDRGLELLNLVPHQGNLCLHIRRIGLGRFGIDRQSFQLLAGLLQPVQRGPHF